MHVPLCPCRRSVKIVGFHLYVLQLLGVIVQRTGDDVNHVVLVLHDAFDQQQMPAHQRLAKMLLRVLPHHDIAAAGFIFQREEQHARGAARALATGDQSGEPLSAHGLGEVFRCGVRVPSVEPALTGVDRRVARYALVLCFRAGDVQPVHRIDGVEFRRSQWCP